MKVLVPHDEGLAELAGLPGVVPVRYDPAQEVPRDARDACVVVPPFLAGNEALALLDQLPRLRLVQLLTAGAETWIGRMPRGVLLSDCRGAHGGATAEWVLTALLSLYRHIPRFVEMQQQRHWDYHQTEELAGKRVLVVGAGDVAGATSARLHAFDATTTLVARRSRPGMAHIGELAKLLPLHDAVVLAVPLTTATRGLCDKTFMAAMPDGSVLVNASRGPVVDTAALLFELTSGRLRAALDVTDPEPLPQHHPLWEAPGLLLTPHVAGSVPLGLARSYRVVAQQIGAFARGLDPPNTVLGDY